MADTKISGLPASTTPLAGTEELPIVQSGVTKKVSVENLTAGRAISATQVTVSTGNLVIGTAGKGIDFSANPSATGMTSELLADYEEGTWTPTYIGLTTNPTFGSYGIQVGYYVKIGQMVYVSARLRTTGYNSDGSGVLAVGGLPFASAAGTVGGVGNISILAAVSFTTAAVAGYMTASQSYVILNTNTLFNNATVAALGTGANNNDLCFFGVYRAS